MTDVTQILSVVVGDLWLQAALLFFGPFVLEEGALMAASLLAASEELSPYFALAAVYLGIVVSDWALYGLGRSAGRLRWVRRLIREENLTRGTLFLNRNLFSALLLARLVPWLLFPIFVACGFLRVTFVRFALINAGLALVYAASVFLMFLVLDIFLLESLGTWGWVIALVLIAVVFLVSRLCARRSKRKLAKGLEEA